MSQPLGNLFRQHETTIRSSMKAGDLKIRWVLLGNLRLPLDGGEPRQGRRVMLNWSVHLVSPSAGGLLGFPTIWDYVISRDPVSLAFFPRHRAASDIHCQEKLIAGAQAGRWVLKGFVEWMFDLCVRYAKADF